MARARLFLGLATALLAFPAVALACVNAPQPQLPRAPLAIETLRGLHAFTVEVAVTREQKSCGLMRRPRLKQNAGMLFRHDPPGPTYFWMKNTPQPLDMVFIDSMGRVIHLAEHTTPYSTAAYGTDSPVAAVLELRAGTASRIALELGDRVKHAWFGAAKAK